MTEAGPLLKSPQNAHVSSLPTEEDINDMDILTNLPEGDRSGGGEGLGLGGVKEKLWEKRVEEKSQTKLRLNFESSPKLVHCD